MVRKNMLWGIALALTVVLASAGCKKTSSADSDKSGGSGGKSAGGSGGASPQRSGVEREAQESAMTEVARHCVKGPDGWTSAITSGSPYAPDHFLRQFREVTVEGVETAELTDSDRLNGMEWAGQVAFKSTPAREAGDPGIVLDGMGVPGLSRQRGRWTQWMDYQPFPIRLQKVKGKWQINQDTTLLHGALPTAGDFAKAGVK